MLEMTPLLKGRAPRRWISPVHRHHRPFEYEHTGRVLELAGTGTGGANEIGEE